MSTTVETPTAPLSPTAVEAMLRLEAAFAPQSEMSEADRLAHELASYVRRPARSEVMS
ncbi:hypothetical protein ACIF8T_21690 [Streptomyces sp. NPDC085946]|uniref:hypothetical protein n=1 Tax=Streptomyces sp. NPDC085946 TaxID=3365744 RepID=UPI0037D58FEA